MSEDELLVGVVFAIAALFGWGCWYRPLITVVGFGRGAGSRWPLAAAPLVAAAMLATALRTMASFDVRESPLYLGFYLVFGAGWVALTLALHPLLGVSGRADAIEGGNRAAAWAVAGAIIGATACFAGANIGDGPGWWCVAVAGGLATATWVAGWFALALAGSSAAVTIERDPAAGLRLGAWLVASGIVCGRAAAGDWTSLPQTIIEFATVWPLVPMLGLAIACERWARATPQRPQGDLLVHGVLPAAVAIVLALLALAGLDPVPQNPVYPPHAVAP